MTITKPRTSESGTIPASSRSFENTSSLVESQVVFEGDRFLVVRKREGIPAQVTTRTDPRS